MASEPSPPEPRGRWLRTTLRALRAVVAGLLVLVVTALLVLQLPWPARFVARSLLRAAAPVRGAVAEVKGVRGSWITSLELIGVRVTRRDTLLLAADTLRVSYSPLGLLHRHVVIRDLTLRGGFFVLMPPDSTVKQTPASPRPPAEWLTGRFYSGIPLRAHRISLARCGFAAFGDSSGVHAEDLRLEARDLALGGGPAAIELDTLGVRFRAPGIGRWSTLAARASLDARRLEVQTLDLTSNTTALTARGTVALSRSARDSIRDAEFTLDAKPLDLADLAFFIPGTPARGKVAAELRIHGVRFAELEGTLHASTAGATFGGVELGATTAEARLARGRLEFETRGAASGFPIEAEGWLSDFRDEPNGRLVARIPALPATIPGLPTWNPSAPRRALLEATITRGIAASSVEMITSGERLALRGNVDLRRLPSVTLRRGDLLRLDDDGAVVQGGRLTFDSLRVIAGATPRLRLAGAHVQDLDLASWLGQQALASAIGARLEGELRLGAKPVADARLDLEPSTFGVHTISEGRLKVHLADGALSLDGNVESSAGRVSLRAQGRPFDREPHYTIPDARFENVNLAAWTGNPALQSKLAGSLTLEATPGDSGAVRASGTLALARSTFGTLRIESGEAQGRVAGPDWNTDASLRLANAAPLSLRAGGSANRLTADLETPLEVLVRLAGRDSLAASGRARLALEFSGPDPRIASGTGALVASGTIGEARFDTVRAEFHSHSGVFDVDTLFVRSNTMTAGGGGRLALFDTTGSASAFRLHADVTDATRLAALAGLDSLVLDGGHADFEVTGPAQRVVWTAAIGARHFAIPGVDARTVVVQGNGTLDATLRPSAVGLTTQLERIDAAGLRFEGVTAAVGGALDSLVIDAKAGEGTPRSLRVRGTLSGDTARRVLDIAEAAITGPRFAWSLSRPARITVEPVRITFDSFEAHSDSGTCVIAGSLSRQEVSNFRCDLKGVSVATLAAWAGREDLGGRLDASLRIDGPAEAPSVTGAIDGSIRSDHGAGDVRAKLDWREGLMAFESTLSLTGSSPIQLTARLPLALSLAAGSPLVSEREGNVALRLTGSGVSVPALGALANPQNVVPRAGTLDLDVTLGGTSRRIEGHGRTRLTGGAFDLPGLGVSYTGVELETKLEGREIEIVQARAESGKGSIKVGGKVTFERLSRVILDLDLTAHRFQLIHTRDQAAVVSGELHVTGTSSAPVVQGKVLADQTEIYLKPTTTGSAVDLTPDDLAMLEEHFGEVNPQASNGALLLYDASRIDLDVTLGAAVWVRQRVAPRIAAKLEGGLKITKEPHGQPMLTGRITPTPRRGFVEEFARQFDFDEGSEMRLNGPIEDTDIDFKVYYKVEDRDESGKSQVVVRLNVVGRFDDLKLILSSEPPMDQSEIIRYIMTGQSDTEGNTSSGGAELAAQVGLSKLTAGLEEYAQRAIGLDVVQVRQDGLQGTTLIAGRYMSSELYVGFRQPVSSPETSSQTSGTANSTQYELEYAAYQWLTLNLLAETSRFKSFFRARHAY